jgi:hypothetical protein
VEPTNLFTYRLGSATTSIGRPPVFFPSSCLISAGFKFASVYAVTKTDAEAISSSGSAAGFKGTVWSQRLWVDFDDEAALELARCILKEKGYDFVVYDTGGGRGGHLGILRVSSPSHLLPGQDRNWVSNNLPGADLGLYWHLHLIRLPGTIHESSGKPKVLTAHHLGKTLVLPPWQEGRAVSEERSVHGPGPSVGRKSLFRSWEVMQAIMPTQGESRHRQLLLLASAAKRAGATVEESRWLCGELNAAFEEPKSLEESTRVVDWVYTQE